MMYIFLLRLLLFICIKLFHLVESKPLLGCCNGNQSERNAYLQSIFESKPSIDISQDDLNLKSSQNFKNVSQTSLNFWEVCRLTFINKYEYVLVYVININQDFFKIEFMYDEFGLVQLYTRAETSKTSKAIIIVIGVFDELHKLVHKKPNLWNQDSIFVIVLLDCLKEVKFEMEALWKYHKIYKYVLFCVEQNSTSMYIYRPFVKDTGKRIIKVQDKTNIVDNIGHAIDSLHNSVIRIVLFPQDFFAITDNGKYIGGGDYSPLEILQKSMNFRPLISSPTDGNRFTQIGKNVTGSIRDVVLGIADIAINGHILKDYGNDKIVLSRYVYMDKLCFVVPMPSYNSPYTMIKQIFPESIWLLIALVYFVTIILYYIFEIFSKTKHQKPRFQDLWLQMFAMFIFGATSLKTHNTSTKLLLGGLLLNILIMNNVFQSSLTTVLSKPTRKEYIETLDQVMKSNLVLASKNVEQLINDPTLLQSIYHLKERRFGEKVNVVRVQRFPVSHVKRYRNHLRFRANILSEPLHIVSECIKSDLVSFVLPKNSPLLDRINGYLLIFQESGLTGKWLGRDASLMMQKTYKPLKDNELGTHIRSFTLKGLTFVFTILFIGLGASTVVFFLENIVETKQN